MIDEPYRWLEAIANRREYIQDQLKTGSPIMAIGCDAGLLLATIGRDHQKLFEVYDRIAFSAIGHPADLERLRTMAIDMAHVEGFSRAASDVSVRRLAQFGLSPAMKTAFEQVFASPYIARVLFAELGESPADDILCRVDYDGSFQLKTGQAAAPGQLFAVVAGTPVIETAMTAWLEKRLGQQRLEQSETLAIALEAWATARYAAIDGEPDAATVRLPDGFDPKRALRDETKSGMIEAVVLDRSRPGDNKFVRLDEKELRDVLK